MALVTPPAPGRPFAVVSPTTEGGVLDLDREMLVESYKTFGALLLRGFSADLAAFRGLTGRFCSSSVFNESPDRKLLDGEHNIQSVNGGADPFPLHPELSREPWKPDVCFFACLSPPSAGGATTVCDGVALVEALPAQLRATLAARRLLYVQPAAPEVLQFWLGTDRPTDAQLAAPPAGCPYVFRRVPGAIIRMFSRPALHRPMFAEGLAFGNFLLFARYYLRIPNFPLLDDGRPVPDSWVQAIKAAADRLTVPVAWQRGDVLILDNSRFMHGRTAITNTDERLIASYFGYLDFAEPDAEEPADAPWRRQAFRPPQPRPRPPVDLAAARR